MFVFRRRAPVTDHVDPNSILGQTLAHYANLEQQEQRRMRARARAEYGQHVLAGALGSGLCVAIVLWCVLMGIISREVAIAGLLGGALPLIFAVLTIGNDIGNS